MFTKTNLRLPAAILMAGFILCSLPTAAATAKSYAITHVDIDARLQPDGSLDVIEDRTYGFDGSFTFAYRDLPEGGPVTFEEFAVSEAGRPYRLAGTEAPGTYNISRSSGRIRVTWYYTASNESRTFTFRYKARGTVKRYEDAAVFYYKFISEEWDIPQSNINVSLKPPTTLSRDEVNEWLHGPLWAQSQITQDGSVLATCKYLPGNSYLEIRALYPPEVFPEVPATAGTVRGSIMAEEARWAEQANRQREAARARQAALERVRQRQRRLGTYVGIAICAAGLMVWWTIYRRYHHKPELPAFLEMTSEIPEHTPPALLGYLIQSRQISGGALVGTMLDLARRGLLALREESEEVKTFWGGTKRKPTYHWDLNRTAWEQNEPKMLDFENALIAFIFDDLAEGADTISIELIKRKRTEFLKFFRSWKQQVESHAKEKHWFDTESIRGMYYSLAVAGAIIVVAILSIFLFRAWAMISLAGGCVVLVLSLFIPHRTAEGETRARHWMAVRKYLQKYEFRTADRQSLLARISDYLVYGVVLGLSTELYNELATYIPERAHGTYVPWYVYHGTGTGGFSPAAFGAAFSSMVATTTSAMSTAAGAGGGASAGGGGGASSGGGGAG